MFAMDAISPIANRVKRNLEETGQIPKIEKKTLTPDVSKEYTDILGIDLLLQRVSDTPIDLHTFCEGKYQLNNGDTFPVYPENVSFVEDDAAAYLVSGDASWAILSVPLNSVLLAGLYFTEAVASATFETITPIDPKYLPSGGGGGLPVVELGISVTQEEFDGQLSEAVSQKLKEAAENNLPIIASLYVQGLLYCLLFTLVKDGGAAMYTALIHSEGDIISFQMIGFADNQWTYTVVPVA